MLVTVIIVNFNGINFLQKCLDSIANAFRHHAYEVIVVDNASTDGSPAWLTMRKDIVLIESKVNLGFTGGNNLGAMHAKGDCLLFLNNDTYIKTALDELIDAVEKKHVAIAGCRLVYGDFRQQFSFGYRHTPLRIILSWLGLEKFHRLPSIFRRIETDPNKYLIDQQDVDWISGACFAIRSETWRQLKGFDTDFFMYCEDVDLCLRARSMGLNIVYIQNCCVVHFEGAGKPWIGYKALERTAHSYQIFSQKHFSKATVLVISLALGSIFLCRSCAFFMLSFFSKSKKRTRRDKSIGFSKVGLRLIKSIPKYCWSGKL